MSRTIDINCDVGEGVNNEHLLLPYLGSCSVACGGHAGDEDQMRKVVDLAREFDVLVGAHPSYPDKKNFGRLSMDITASDLTESIRQQISDLKQILVENKMELHHIKAHGALYNDIARDAALAATFLEAVRPYKDEACLYVPYGSVIADLALKQGFDIIYEAFADRNYNDDLSLVSRKQKNAVITDTDEVVHHVLNMTEEERVLTINGKLVGIKAGTFCVHSDTPSAVKLVRAVYEGFIQHGYSIG